MADLDRTALLAWLRVELRYAERRLARARSPLMQGKARHEVNHFAALIALLEADAAFRQQVADCLDEHAGCVMGDGGVEAGCSIASDLRAIVEVPRG
jgi:hypothetical protein